MKIINLILFLLITVQINAQDYILKNNGPYNDKIMSPEEFLGYEIGFEHPYLIFFIKSIFFIKLIY